MNTIVNDRCEICELEKFIENNKGIIGENEDKLPILVKFIDANQDLSIQVHPSDENAINILGESGKMELWYIIEAQEDAHIYYGLKQALTKDEFIRYATNGEIIQYLNKIPVKRGDVFPIYPGTIHAIGKGILLAEVQQNSNTTFRIYDYNRKDINGNYRPIHLERAAQVVSLQPTNIEKYQMNIKVKMKTTILQQIFSCKYFESYKIILNDYINLYCSRESFHHILVIEGELSLIKGKQQWILKAGESWFVPAGFHLYDLRGKGIILLSKLNGGL